MNRSNRVLLATVFVRCLGAIFFALLLSAIAEGQSHDDEATPEVQSLYAQAKAAQRNGDDATAIKKYLAMLKLAPHLAPAYNNLGALYFDQHDYAQAARTLQRGLELNHNMPTASAILGMSYLKLGRNQEAKEPLEAALSANPSDNNAELALARVLINLREYEDAAAHLRLYLARNPKDQQALYLIGKTYLQLSENALGQIETIDPNSVVAHEVAGEIDESMRNYDGALVEFKKAVELAPTEPGTHFRLGHTFWSISKWDTASAEFQAELVNDPRNCRALWELGNSILELNGPFDAALSDLNKAIDYCPTLVQARVDRARALIKLNQFAKALPDLNIAKADSPNEPSIHFLLSTVYKAQGNAEASQQEMSTYARLKREASASVAAQADKSISIKSEAH